MHIRRFIIGTTALLALAASAAAQEQRFGNGNIVARTTRDPITDHVTGSAIVEGRAARASLHFSCYGLGIYEVSLFTPQAFLLGERIFPGHLAPSSGAPRTLAASYRFTGGQPVTGLRFLQASPTLAMLPREQQAGFNADALIYGEVTMRLIDGRGDSVTETFDLTGLRAALQALPPCK